MAIVTSIEELRRSPTSARFDGHENVAISIFVTEFQRGRGPSLHLHPYQGVFPRKLLHWDSQAKRWWRSPRIGSC